MILFDKRKFIAVEGEIAYKNCKKWVEKCHGKEVVNGRCGDFFMAYEWTVNTDDLVFSLEESKKYGLTDGGWTHVCDGEPVEVDCCHRLYVRGKDGGHYFVYLDWCVEKSEPKEQPESEEMIDDDVIKLLDLVFGAIK